MLFDIHPTHPEPRKIQMVVKALRNGGVIVCPTDTVYAFVCSSENQRAIEKLTRLKGAKPGKAELSLVCADLSHLSDYARAFDTSTFRILKRALPGPYTFILPATSAIPRLFSNKRRTVGIRVPNHAVPMAIVRELGHALASASVHDPDDVLEYTSDPGAIQDRLGAQVDLVIDSGPGGLIGSTVIDTTEGTPVVLREGKGEVTGLF